MPGMLSQRCTSHSGWGPSKQLQNAAASSALPANALAAELQLTEPTVSRARQHARLCQYASTCVTSSTLI